jgi:hypothetical protein
MTIDDDIKALSEQLSELRKKKNAAVANNNRSKDRFKEYVDKNKESINRTVYCSACGRKFSEYDKEVK